MLLEVKNITKKFGEAEVLKGISFQLKPGEIMGLVGENGAGKSTLMNILGGIFPPNDGQLKLGSHTFSPKSPNDSLEAGIAFIHQELNLFPNLNIPENLFLNRFPRKKIAGISFIDKKEATARATDLLHQVGLDVNPTTLVENLSPAQKQLLEIAKALSTSPRIIIFDEPTTSLTRYEAEKLFELAAKLKSQHIAMIYISHNLEDVTRLADNIMVLRDGKMISHYAKDHGYRLDNIINDMVGRDMDQFFPERAGRPQKDCLLEVSGLTARGLVKDVSFSVKKQEVLGFYGLVGAGRSEMVRLVYGLDPFDTGKVRWQGKTVPHPSPAGWIRERVAFLTEDRREEGLLLDQNLEKNIALASLRRFAPSPMGIVNRQALSSAALTQADATKTKYHSMTGQPVATLSGGNQQKVVLAKWLLIDPVLMFMDEPTKGIDVGAKHEIYRLINRLVDNGAGVVMISSEIEELLGLCDRILVMNQGRISAAFEKNRFNRSAILEAALHTKKQKQ